MPTKHVPIYKVQVGMYVAKLDLSWLRSPFLRHSFLIDEPAQIEKLVRAGVGSVKIDLTRGINVPTGTEPTGAMTSLNRTQFPLRVRVTPVKSLAQLNEEYARAPQAKDQLERSMSTVFSAFAKGTADARHATEAVREITIVTRTIANSAIFLALSQNRTGDGAAYPVPLMVDLARQDNQAGERIIDAVLPPVPAHALHAAERRGG